MIPTSDVAKWQLVQYLGTVVQFAISAALWTPANVRQTVAVVLLMTGSIWFSLATRYVTDARKQGR